MADERDDFSSDEQKKPTFGAKAKRFHDRMVQGNLEDIVDLKRQVALRVYRFGLLLVTEINRTELTRRAAALTYTTILSLFPLLAVISAFASQFYTPEKEAEFIGYIEKQFLPSVEKVPLIGIIGEDDIKDFEEEQQKVLNVRKFFSEVSTKFRQNAGGVGIFGFIGLLVTAGLLYYSIESVVNQTWQEGAGQWTRTLTNFITILVFFPIVIGLSITATGLAYTLLDPELDAEQVVTEAVEKVTETEEEKSAAADPAEPDLEEETGFVMGPPSPEVLAKKLELYEQQGPPALDEETGDTEVIAEAIAEQKEEEEKALSPTLVKVRKLTRHFAFMLKILPVLVNTFLLSIAYAFLPKTRVKFRYALLGGLIAAVLWEGARYLFVYYMYWSRVNRSLADAFGLAVIFLIWVYITWLVLLLGNLMVYLTQNFQALWSERRTGAEIAIDSRLYLATMILLARQFTAHGGGYNEHDLRLRLGISQTEFRLIINRLIRTGYVSLLKNETFQLAHPPNKIAAQDILRQGCDLSNLPIARRGRTGMAQLFTTIEDRLVALCGDDTLQDLIDKAASATQPQDRDDAPRQGKKPAPEPVVPAK